MDSAFVRKSGFAHVRQMFIRRDIGYFRHEMREVTITRDQLLDDLHGTASSMDRSVDSHIKNLRRKLETVAGQSMIETVYGIGYRFVER